MHSSHLHVEKVTPLVLWIATPRKRCPGGWYLGAVHSFYTLHHTTHVYGPYLPKVRGATWVPSRFGRRSLL